TMAILNYYDQRMAQRFLADFIQIGHSSTGSRALAQEKVDFFGFAIDAWMDSICEVLNRYAIPRLMALNGYKGNRFPRITHGPAALPQLKELGAYLAYTSANGLITPDPALESYLRTIASFPPRMDADTASQGNSSVSKHDQVDEVLAAYRKMAERQQIEAEIGGDLDDVAA
ncbi:MAG: hypothetical protein KGR26_10190, partial [Cyanobacteria bacterium REEB65]|nr:hypothetical protein [Cyanobacteria bacterium REEB65]